MQGLLQGRRTIVTGATGGIGSVIARRMKCAGARVVGIDYRTDGDAGFPLVVGDIETRDGRHAAISRAIELAGGDAIMVHCAIWMRYGELAEIEQAHFDRLLASAVGGILWSVQAALPTLGRGASIVNLSSVAAFRGARSSLLYGAAKGAVDAMTRHLAAELGPAGIRVNAIAPGFVDTEAARRKVGEARIEERLRSTPLGALPRPEAIADAAIFLASDHAAAISGETLIVDGGRNATAFND